MRWLIKPRISGYSIIGLFNLFCMQWFFIRIEANVNEIDDSISIGIMGFVLPMTGWWSPYIRLGTWRTNNIK